MAKPGRKTGSIAKYYKGKYMLVLYDMNDDFIDVFDNAHQLADWLDTTYESIIAGIGRAISGESAYLMKNRKTKYKVYTVEVDEE